MTTKLELELERFSYSYPELAKAFKEFLGDGKAVQSSDNKPSLEDRKEIFQHWASAFQKKRVKFKAGSKRDAKIVARLKSFTKEEIFEAITGFAMDPWRHGELVRHELHTLLRSDEQVEAGLDINNNGGRRDNSAGRFGSTQHGQANSTISYGREGTPGVPEHGNRERIPVQHDNAQWGKMRWGRPLGEEEDPW